MVQSGMADHGYQYVNIDDAWMGRPRTEDPDEKIPARDERGMINANRRFPDMKALTDHIHGLGLQGGHLHVAGRAHVRRLSTVRGSTRRRTPSASSSGASTSSSTNWCSYSETPRPRPDPEIERRQRPYRLMGDILRQQPRDIVFNLCQYGMGEVWKWGAEVGGHSWRTTGDLGLEKADRLPGFYRIGFKNAELADYAGPGRWNDPDYILIGSVGNAHNIEEPPKPTTLTRHEQYSYMSMWALMAAPLFYSGDITRLDPFTLNVLNNAEVIAIDQDPLGRQARILRKTDDEFRAGEADGGRSIAVGPVQPVGGAARHHRDGGGPGRQGAAARTRSLEMEGRRHDRGRIHRECVPPRGDARPDVAGEPWQVTAASSPPRRRRFCNVPLPAGAQDRAARGGMIGCVRAVRKPGLSAPGPPITGVLSTRPADPVSAAYRPA